MKTAFMVEASERWFGYIDPKLLIPTESQPDYGAESAYQAAMIDHVRAHGFGTPSHDEGGNALNDPCDVYYSDRGEYGGGRKQNPKLYLQQGHHRWKTAKALGKLLWVVVHSTEGLGRPPQLRDAA